MELSRTRVQEILLIIWGGLLIFLIVYIGFYHTGSIDEKMSQDATSLLNAISEYQIMYDGQLPGEITFEEKEICAELQDKQICDAAGLLFIGKIGEILDLLPINSISQKPRTGYFVSIQNNLLTVETVNEEGNKVMVTRPSLQ